MPLLLAIVVALLLYGTLSPFHFHARPGHPFLFMLHALPPRFDRNGVRDAVLNVAMFLPLGVAAFLTFAGHFRRNAAAVLTIIHASAFSLAIELAQYYIPSRYSSAVDWLWNTVGAIAGVAVGAVFQKRIEAALDPAQKRGTAPGLLLAVCWMGSQLYPVLPQFSRARLGAGWAYLAASPVVWVDVLATLACWYVFALTLGVVWGKLPWGWLALFMLAAPLRLAIVDRVVTWSELMGAAAAIVLWVATPERFRHGVAWLLLAAAIICQELAPFRFPGPVHAFSWAPLGATMAAEHAPGVAVVLRKAFEYGAAVWLLRAGLVGYVTSAVGVATALAAMEVVQMRMPGRVAEITDPLLVLLMAFVLRLVN